MRSLSATAIAAAQATETGEVFAFLVTVEHDSLSTPLRFTTNNEEIVSQGEAFIPFPFDVSLVDETPNELPQVTLTICAVDQSLVDDVRRFDTPPKITIELVLTSTPDVIEAAAYQLTWNSVKYNAFVIEGTLGPPDTLTSSFPKERFTPRDFPSL